MKDDKCFIYMDNLSLVYDLYYDRTNSLKGYVGSFFKKNRYVEKRKDKLSALKNINIKIEHGERVGIIGLNGSGKSTFLKVASGLLKPSAGSMKINGFVQPLIEVGAGFNPEFSGRENIYLNGTMLGFTKKVIKEKEEEIIRFAELEEFIDVPVKYYSSGMNVRLAFTIATIIKPEILLLDEMLSAGDLAFMSKAKKRMDDILGNAKILVIVSHDLDLIESLAMRSIVLCDGEIVFDGNTSHAIAYYRHMVEDIINFNRAISGEILKNNNIVQEISEDDQVNPDEQENEKNQIAIKSVICRSASDTDSILPGDDIEFSIEFETLTAFNEFYITLIIYDGANEQIARLKNDYDNKILTDIEIGTYTASIVLHGNPFKSGKYLYNTRISGKAGSEGMVSVISEKKQMIIKGERQYSAFLNQEWNVEKK